MDAISKVAQFVFGETEGIGFAAEDTFGGAFEDQSDFDNISFAVGLQFEIPIGNRAARAGYRRTSTGTRPYAWIHTNLRPGPRSRVGVPA